MRIENEMLSRFSSDKSFSENRLNEELSSELDFFFNNVMDTVVDFFKTKEEINM